MNPRVQAILIADKVYEDKSTGKKVVAGIFDKIGFVNPEQIQERLAAQGVEGAERKILGGMSSGSPTCYMRLIDVRGEQSFVLRYVYVNEDQVLFRTEFRITSNDPLQAVDVVLPLPVLPTDKAGTFALELVWNDEVLGSHRIISQEIPHPEGE